MCAEFGKLGLLHLMAISGFHFALVGGIFASLLRLFFPQRATVVLLIFLLSSYFFFLGSSPSIVRAWTMSVIAFTAFLLERKPLALNALGASFLFILIFDPLLVNTMGFQFSAAVTASILLFYPITNSILENFIAKRSLSKVSQMHSFDQHCYFILSVFREAFALTLAVNIIATPLSLYYFSKFPLMSLIYNFFVPFLVSCSLFFLILSSLFYLLFPYLGLICFSLTAHFTHFMLNFIYNAPSSMNVYWYIPNIPSLGISLYLTLAFCSGIFAKKTNQNHSQDAWLL